MLVHALLYIIKTISFSRLTVQTIVIKVVLDGGFCCIRRNVACSSSRYSLILVCANCLFSLHFFSVFLWSTVTVIPRCYAKERYNHSWFYKADTNDNKEQLHMLHCNTECASLLREFGHISTS